MARLEELLSDLEAGVRALGRVRAGVKRYKASVLKAACEGKLFDVGERLALAEGQMGRLRVRRSAGEVQITAWRIIANALIKVLDRTKENLAEDVTFE